MIDNIHILNKWIRRKIAGGDTDCAMFDNEANDGTFLMEYNEWCEYYNNLFVCLNFPDEWAGIRFKGNWNEFNCGGTPTKL